VFVLEPQPQVLLHALMIHDFSGDAGPIAAERFRWFIGETWTTEFDRAVEERPTIGVPGITLQQGFTGQPVATHVQATLKSIGERDAAAKREIEAHYATLTPEILAELFGPTPRIRPRVALITTRFSTVLQYSTRDTAAAFEALGWEALVLIEPTPSHRLYEHAIRKALADFKPHAVFQIDHLRHEHRDLFPANLPFICWGQDHLASLITRDAGRRVGELDFVLTDNPVGYARNYDYPARQLISTPKLTSPAQPAAAPKPCSSGVVARTASYAFSLVIGPREAMYLPSEVQERNIKAGQVMLGGEMAMIGRVPAGMRVYNLEVHVCTRGGAVVTTLSPKIVVDDPKRRRPTKLPVAIMAGVAEGIRDYHYGNDVALRPGARITVTVTVRGERAVLEATVPKRA
jgi:hypothetical protein